MAFGASENTIEYGVNYMNIYALGTIFVEVTLGMNAFITSTGLCKNRYAIRADRSGCQYYSGPCLYFRTGHGRTGSCPGYDHLTGAFLYLGGQLPGRKENVPEDQKEESG